MLCRPGNSFALLSHVEFSDCGKGALL
jgi:hypothetical protein